MASETPAQRAARAIAVVKVVGAEVRDGESTLTVKDPRVEPPAPHEPVVRATKGAFMVLYAVPEGERVDYLSGEALSAARLTVEDVHRIGLRNLVEVVNGEPGLQAVQEGAAYGLLMGGRYESSLVLLDPLWEGPLARHAPHGAVVALPLPELCVFCDAGSTEGMEQLRQIVERVQALGERLLSDRLFRRAGRRWEAL
jgi:hypothetical protein